AVAGCDVVFHCAWGGESLADARRINVEGTRHLLEAAAKAGVRRLIHRSTMAVHGDALPSELTEAAPLVTRGDAYGVSKAEGEQLARELGGQRGIEGGVLRSTRGYGPGGVRRVEGGPAPPTLVVVEDLVDAMWAAAEAPGAAGAACLVSGAHPVTWAA